MTFDVDEDWSITIRDDKPIDRNSWTAEGIIFKRGNPDVTVDTITGSGKTRDKAINDTLEKAKDRIFELKRSGGNLPPKSSNLTTLL